jgi:hypothetical protein
MHGQKNDQRLTIPRKLLRNQSREWILRCLKADIRVVICGDAMATFEYKTEVILNNVRNKVKTLVEEERYCIEH